MTKSPGMERREFLAAAGWTLVGAACSGSQSEKGSTSPGVAAAGKAPRPVSALPQVFLAKSGSPAGNAAALLEAAGGIENLVGAEDLLILKPNSQWYAQGMTNTDLMAAVIEAVLARPGGFRGEILVADNHHCQEDNSRAFTTDKPNGRWNLNDLVRSFSERGAPVAKVHWHDAGPNPTPWQFDAGNGRRVEGPDQGDGYRWQLDECFTTSFGNRCAMTWPVFRSPVSQDVIDLRHGIFRSGKATGRPLKFWNISSICHHSRYCGVTASIKNLMGVVDMTCGFQGPEPAGYFNTHYVGMRRTHGTWRWASKTGGVLRKMVHKVLPEEKTLEFWHTGGALGRWIRSVRRPDLNIITAEWIGFGSRTVASLAARPGISACSTDPVALDSTLAREVLLPATRNAGSAGRPFLSFNDPDRATGPFQRFLREAHKEIGGEWEPRRIEIVRLGRWA